jgi:hypothetical protein
MVTMTAQPSIPESSPRRQRRVFGLVSLGAWFGSICGIVAGLAYIFFAGFEPFDSVVGSIFGGVPGAAVAMLFVGSLGGRKCRQLDQMHSAAFSGSFGTIVGCMAGIGLLNLLELATGPRIGRLHGITEDMMIILFVASAAGILATWAVSHLSNNERWLQFAVLAMFLATVASLFITPAALPFGIAGAVAGHLSQRMLVSR